MPIIHGESLFIQVILGTDDFAINIYISHEFMLNINNFSCSFLYGDNLELQNSVNMKIWPFSTISWRPPLLLLTSQKTNLEYLT